MTTTKESILKSIHDWAAKAWWRSALLVTLCGAVTLVGEHYLGAGNLVSGIATDIENAVQAPDVSPTTVQ